jgi:hypothetical protein
MERKERDKHFFTGIYEKEIFVFSDRDALLCGKKTSFSNTVRKRTNEKSDNSKKAILTHSSGPQGDLKQLFFLR